MFLKISFAQFNETGLGIAINSVYTTSASIFLSPNSSDPEIRNRAFIIEHIFNPAIDIRYKLSGDLIIGLNADFMKTTAPGRNLTVLSEGNTLTIEVEDGFFMIPVEFSLYYLIPFSTESFKFLMGGGCGIYFGEHIRKFGNAEVKNIEKKFAYGIHVSVSMDYLIKDNISLRTELKFRDPQFSVKSAYTKKDVKYNGQNVKVVQDSFDSKINVDGSTFILGIVFHL
ncbi:MAG: hypothetical protein HXY49_04815 [Ignavibacteriaceae bacterium]|nr:hypothetical protein [Ignavibacteriaceae bacterium]